MTGNCKERAKGYSAGLTHCEWGESFALLLTPLSHSVKQNQLPLQIHLPCEYRLVHPLCFGNSKSHTGKTFLILEKQICSKTLQLC